MYQPYHKLRVRFAEMEMRQGDVAQAAGMAKSTMNIPREQYGEYFFEPSPKSKKGA